MLRIVSEGGAGPGTKLVNAETGEDVGKFLNVMFGGTITIDEMVRARFELAMPAIDVVAAQTEFRAPHPISKSLQPVAAVEFTDGWRIDFSGDGTPRVSRQTPTGDK